jgi:ABC-type Na+ efflux pump permease subunit
VPYLFIEEKESHTLEALLVSPANFSQLVAGKLIAGAVYCLIAATIILLINFRLIVHWDLMLATVLLGTAFAVGVGLLLGMLFDNAASLGLWSSLLTLVLLLAPLVQMVGAGKIPAALQAIFSWLPSTAISRLSVLAMLGEVPASEVWQGVFILTGATVAIFLLVVWRMRQLDR